ECEMTMRTKSAAEWTAEKDQNIQAARAIADAADTAGRPLTGTEEKQITDHIRAAKSAAEKANTQTGREAIDAELSILGTPAGSGARGKSRTPGAWSKAAVDALPGVGRKELTSSGSVTMPSLSSTLIADPDRARTLLALIPVTPLDGTDTFSYLRATNVT